MGIEPLRNPAQHLPLLLTLTVACHYTLVSTVVDTDTEIVNQYLQDPYALLQLYITGL